MLAVVSKPSPISQQSLLPSWVQEGSTAMLFLHNMSKPRHGQLYLNDGQWYFCFGNSKDFEKGVQLLDFSNQHQSLLDTGQLFWGHTKFSRVYQARHQAQLHNYILQHVSAHGLDSLIAPTSLKHHSTMTTNDKNIWDAAYNEEYDGLAGIPTWEVITEQQFKQLSKGVKPLPSMAISTIKYDENNKPKRAKY